MGSIFDKSIPDLRAIAELRQWGPREPLDHRKLNEPVDAINKMVRGVRPARQIRFAEAPADEERVVQVLMSAVPNTLTGAMEIQRAAYRASPPVLHQLLKRIGQPFTGYMAYGRRPEEYIPYLYTAVVPTVDSPFLFARREGDLWLVDIPVHLEEKVVAVALVGEPDHRTGAMQVRRVKWHVDLPAEDIGTALNWASAPFAAYIDFGNTPADYTRMVHAGGSPDQDGVITTARKEGAHWFVELPQVGPPTQFQIVDNFGDYVTAKPYDGTDIVNETLHYIAKRWLLRRTPFDENTIDGVLYDYANDYHRTAVKTMPDESVRREEQFLTPPYGPFHSVIWATERPRYGTGVTAEVYPPDGVGPPETVDVTWLADVDGRHWAWDGEESPT